MTAAIRRDQLVDYQIYGNQNQDECKYNFFLLGK